MVMCKGDDISAKAGRILGGLARWVGGQSNHTFGILGAPQPEYARVSKTAECDDRTSPLLLPTLTMASPRSLLDRFLALAVELRVMVYGELMATEPLTPELQWKYFSHIWRKLQGLHEQIEADLQEHGSQLIHKAGAFHFSDLAQMQRDLSSAPSELLSFIRAVQVDRTFQSSGPLSGKSWDLDLLRLLPNLQRLTVEFPTEELTSGHGITYRYSAISQVSVECRDQLFSAVAQKEVISKLPSLPRGLRLDLRFTAPSYRTNGGDYTVYLDDRSAETWSRMLSDDKYVLHNSKFEVTVSYTCTGATADKESVDWEELQIEEKHGGYCTWHGMRDEYPDGLPPGFICDELSCRVLQVHGPGTNVRQKR
jgi:hypothetical protein